MNPFSKILSSLNFKFGKSSESSGGSGDRFVGIDVGTSSIKVVEIRKKNGKGVLETYSTLALGPYAGTDVGTTTNLSSELLTKAIGDAIKEGAVGTTNALFSVPSASSLVFTIELPASISEKDLSATVPTEARKYIPVPISEVSLDYWVIPRHGENLEEGSVAKPVEKTEVLIAAIHNETLSKYREIAKNAGLSSDTFEIEVFSDIRSSFGHELSAVLIMDFGASRTKLAIVEYGVVRMFHIINKGSAEITNNISRSLSITFPQAQEIKHKVGMVGEGADKSSADIAKLLVDQILAEAITTVKSFERKYNKPVSKVILSGAGSLLNGFRDAVEIAFHIETVYSNPFDKISVPEFVQKLLTETGPEFSVALGVALRKMDK